MKRLIAVISLLLALPLLASALAAPSGATPLVGVTGQIDWSDAESGVTFPEGWFAHPCNPDVPLICVDKAGVQVGIVSVGASPVSTYDDAELAATHPRRFLRRQARMSLDIFTEDRQTGCAPDYRVRRDDIRTAGLVGARGVQYGFAGGYAGEPFTERIKVRLAIAADHVIFFNASAHDPGGCIGTDELVFTTALLRDFGARFGALANRTPVPDFILTPGG